MNTDHVFPQALQAGNLAQATGGLTLRDYFAAQALPAVTSDCLRVLEKEGFPDEKWRDGIANEAYKIADAMLKAREAAMTTQLPEALPALIERLRLLPIDHAPDGWPAVRTREITALLDRITELEAQLAAIGAGGVEPLRRRECLHQIGEPEREYLKSTMNQAIHEKIIAWDKHEAPAVQGSTGWVSVNERLPQKNTEVPIFFAESSLPATWQYTVEPIDRHGWCYPKENHLWPGEHPDFPDGGAPTVTVDASAKKKLLQGWGAQLDRVTDAINALREALEQPAPAAQGDALSDAVRVPLDSLHADAAKAAIRARAAHGQAPQVGSVPKAQFDDPKVQAVYAILCEDAEPPKGEHWEGFAARRIVDAFHGIKGDQPAC